MNFIILRRTIASWTLLGGMRALARPYRAESGSLAREARGTLGSNILIDMSLNMYYLSLSPYIHVWYY